MAWNVVRLLNQSASQVNGRIPVPSKSIGKRAIVQIDANSGSFGTLYTGLFWTSAAAVSGIQSYPVSHIEVGPSYIGAAAGSASLVPVLGDFLGIRLNTFGGLPTNFLAYVAFEE